MDAREISIEFARAFCAADLTRIQSLLSPSFRLDGPLFQFESREAYLQSLRDDPPEPGSCTVLRTVASEDEAAILFRYDRSPAPVLVAQFNHIRAGLISEAQLVFDVSVLRGRRARDGLPPHGS